MFRWLSPTCRPTPSSGGARCRPRVTARRFASSTARRSCARSSAGWPSCSGSRRSRAGRVRHRDRRRRPRRAGRSRLRRVGRAADDRGRARGAGRPGGHVIADRELPRVPVGRLGGRAREPCAAAGAQARRRDPRDPRDHADRRGDAPGAPRRRRRSPGADDHPGVRCHVAALDDRGLRPARREGDLLRRGAQRGDEHARPRHPHHRRRQLGRPGGDVLLGPCAQRDDHLPRRHAREEHVAAISSTSSPAARTSTCASGPRWWRPTATRRSRRSTSAKRATGETERLESGGLFIFIGADAETGWLPPEIALDPKGYVLTGGDVRGAGRWQLERDPYLLETSVPGIFACGDVRFGPVKRVAAAVGEGSMAIAFVAPVPAGSSNRPNGCRRGARACRRIVPS